MKVLVRTVLCAAIICSIPSLVDGGERGGTTLVAPPWTHCLGLHKVTQFHLDVYSGYHEKFNDPEGLFCIKLTSKDKPETPRDDDELTVYGVNSGNSDIIYNKSLTSIGIVGSRGSGPLQFKEPLALTGDKEGLLFIADTGNNRIALVEYLDDGLSWSREIRMLDGDSLRRPSGVALSAGLLYVADTGNNRIAVFETDGSFVRSFKPEWKGAKLLEPHAIAAITKGDEWVYYGDYFVVVTDSLGGRLWKVTPDGKALGLVRRSALGGIGSFNHVAIDFYGNMYVTDTKADVIHKFDRYLTYIVAIGGGASTGPTFDEPRGITIYRRFGQIFVSERAGAQYFWVGTDILRFSADDLVFYSDTKRVSVKVSFLLTEHSGVSLVLRDEHGRNRFTMLSEYLLPPGRFSRQIEVDCPDAAILAKCKLALVMTAEPTYSSKTYLTVQRESRLLSPRVSTKGDTERR
jgi:hypothetical protein